MNNKIITTGSNFPSFSLPSTEGTYTNQNLKTGFFSVIFIYPADSTPTCTREAIDFSNKISDFNKFKTNVVGLSKDSLTKHRKFISNNNLKVLLVSDEELILIKLLDAWKEKLMYGKKYMGVERTTILISLEGKILHIWRKVKVNGHVDEVLQKIKEVKEFKN